MNDFLQVFLDELAKLQSKFQERKSRECLMLNCLLRSPIINVNQMKNRDDDPVRNPLPIVLIEVFLDTCFVGHVGWVDGANKDGQYSKC